MAVIVNVCGTDTPPDDTGCVGVDVSAGLITYNSTNVVRSIPLFVSFVVTFELLSKLPKRIVSKIFIIALKENTFICFII